MATADQVKSLIKAHIEQDDERFKTITLQIAANEARHGHDTFARELKQYAEKIGKGKKNLIRLNNNGNGMFLVTYPSERLSDLVVSSEIQERIERLLIEYRNRNKLQKYGLSNRRKILIEGRPGTGKTFTASVIAAELDLPLYTIQMDKVVTKFMGETSTKLRQIFDNISTSTGVYFFDEFDAIGADRSLDNEVGEARRILTPFYNLLSRILRTVSSLQRPIIKNYWIKLFLDVLMMFYIMRCQQVMKSEDYLKLDWGRLIVLLKYLMRPFAWPAN